MTNINEAKIVERGSFYQIVEIGTFTHNGKKEKLERVFGGYKDKSEAENWVRKEFPWFTMVPVKEKTYTTHFKGEPAELNVVSHFMELSTPNGK